MVASRRDVIRKKKAKAAYRSAQSSSFSTKSSLSSTAKEASGNVGVDAWILKRALSEANSISALGAAIASNPETPSPELVRSLQAEENWWRRIENELPSMSSTETAAFLGAKVTNRNFASSQRATGKLLGYARRQAIRYPKFQFDVQRGTVLPIIPDLLTLTRGLDVPDEDVVLWMAAPSSAFADQRRPVDHLNDREQLLAAAEAHFGAIW
jgi:hypothetical protein